MDIHCMFILCSVNDNSLHIYFPSRTCVTISNTIVTRELFIWVIIVINM
jgi:hypothetical protein